MTSITAELEQQAGEGLRDSTSHEDQTRSSNVIPSPVVEINTTLQSAAEDEIAQPFLVPANSWIPELMRADLYVPTSAEGLGEVENSMSDHGQRSIIF